MFLQQTYGLLLAILGGLCLEIDKAIFLVGGQDLGVEFELDALLRQ